MKTLRDSAGGRATLGERVGDGGEGTVYRIVERPDLVAKIYSRPMSAEQLAKLAAMVRAADENLRTVAAWPTGLVYDGARPVGFTMPLLAAQRPLHELIGPRSRQEHFPRAHWKFLIHTGANLARAFSVLHERGVVVGDVNSNNVVVCADSTARLIDCDSFQVRAGGALYRCNVGVPDYQPPELQTADFASVERLPQHDLFGLAVMLFQLLFVGKHPFSGVLPPGVPGTGAIGANVAARRFFYHPHARRRGLRPPPGSPTLSAVTPEIANLFTRAFLGEPHQRPTAATWCKALEDIETRTVRCKKNAAHRHLRDAACPWCALERSGLHYFSLPGDRIRTYGVDESIWERCNDREVARIWAEIGAVLRPAPLDPQLTPMKPYKPAPLRLWTQTRVRSYVAGAGVATAGVAAALFVKMPLLAILIAASAIGLGAVFRPDARAAVAQAWRRASAARATYSVALRDWEREARCARFHDELSRLTKLRTRLLAGRKQHDAEIAGLQRRRDVLEWERFAASRTFANYRVVDERTRRFLAGQGIVGVAQITRENLHRVPGITRDLRNALLRWRDNVEVEFLRRPKAPPDPKEMYRVKLRHARERMRDYRAFSEGPENLRRIASEIAERRPAARKRAQQAAEELWRAEADTEISPFLYKTWT